MSFDFKQFRIDDAGCAMKVGTDGVLIGAWAGARDGDRVLDAGAGSGLIALMVAQRADCRVTAVETDEQASVCCRANVANSPFATLINVVNADIMTWRPDHAFDLIVSNPPFFVEPLQSPDARRATARHAADFSPFSLIEFATEWLSDSGRLEMIIPTSLETELIYTAEINRLKVRRICHVCMVEDRDPERVILSLARHDGPIDRRLLTVRRKSGDYTDQFKNLTNPYYLRYPSVK